MDVLNQEIDTLADQNEALKARNMQLKRENDEKEILLSGTPDEEKRRIKIQ